MKEIKIFNEEIQIMYDRAMRRWFNEDGTYVMMSEGDDNIVVFVDGSVFKAEKYTNTKYCEKFWMRRLREKKINRLFGEYKEV